MKRIEQNVQGKYVGSYILSKKLPFINDERLHGKTHSRDYQLVHDYILQKMFSVVNRGDVSRVVHRLPSLRHRFSFF